MFHRATASLVSVVQRFISVGSSSPSTHSTSHSIQNLPGGTNFTSSASSGDKVIVSPYFTVQLRTYVYLNPVFKLPTTFKF
jgi:hypothetical protein